MAAARLLNMGLTAADAGGKPREAWLKSLDKVPRAFIRLLSEPWESLDRQTNIETRHRFWDHDLPQLRPGMPNRDRFASASRVWDLCTQQMGQFAFQSRDSCTDCHNCGSTPPEQTFQPQQSLSLDITKSQVDEIKQQYQGNSPSMAQLIAREFNTFPKRCGKCKAPAGRTRRREVQGDLPLRLLVVPGEYTQSLVTKATSNDIRFGYNSTQGTQTAAYRWLGGIYSANRHFRLYWTDNSDGMLKSHIKTCDGLCASGPIVGGIPVPEADKDDKVPVYWSKAPVVLFYERVSEKGVNDVRESISRQLEAATSLEMEGAVVGSVEPPTTKDEEQEVSGGSLNHGASDDGVINGPIDKKGKRDDNMQSVAGPPQYDGADDDREQIPGSRLRRSDRISKSRTGVQMQSSVVRKRKQEGLVTADTGAADKRVRCE